jgi:ABC-type polysaccharide/polyol phosphate export permease
MINKRNLLIITTLTISEMKGRYRNTWAGFLWVIINPIIMFSVHALVFKHIMKISIDRYYVFLLGGLLPWIFVSSTLTMTSHTLITYREVLLSFQISPMAIMCSKVIDNFVNFLAPFLMLFGFLCFHESFDLIGLLTVPLSMILLLISTYSLAIFFSILQVYLRDVQYILNFGLSILYFLTPIFYPRSMVPDNISWIVDINPVYAIVRPMQIALYNFNAAELTEALWNSLGVTILMVILATLLWRSKRNEIYLYI